MCLYNNSYFIYHIFFRILIHDFIFSKDSIFTRRLLFQKLPPRKFPSKDSCEIPFYEVSEGSKSSEETGTVTSDELK